MCSFKGRNVNFRITLHVRDNSQSHSDCGVVNHCQVDIPVLVDLLFGQTCSAGVRQDRYFVKAALVRQTVSAKPFQSKCSPKNVSTCRWELFSQGGNTSTTASCQISTTLSLRGVIRWSPGDSNGALYCSVMVATCIFMQVIVACVCDIDPRSDIFQNVRPRRPTPYIIVIARLRCLWQFFYLDVIHLAIFIPTLFSQVTL